MGIYTDKYGPKYGLMFYQVGCLSRDYEKCGSPESPSKKPRTKYLESNQLKQNIVQIFEDSNLVGISAAESNQDPQHVESESEAQD